MYRERLRVLEATMRWDEGGERVLYVEEGLVGHGKSGDVQRPGKMAHITVRGTRHRSAIGGREELELQTHAAFARGIWDLVVLCVLWAGFTKPAGTGPVTAVTGLTGPDRFRFRPVLNRPKFKF